MKNIQAVRNDTSSSIRGAALLSIYLQHCVGRDEPVVSLGTNTELIEYKAAMRGLNLDLSQG